MGVCDKSLPRSRFDVDSVYMGEAPRGKVSSIDARSLKWSAYVDESPRLAPGRRRLLLEGRRPNAFDRACCCCIGGFPPRADGGAVAHGEVAHTGMAAAVAGRGRASGGAAGRGGRCSFRISLAYGGMGGGGEVVVNVGGGVVKVIRGIRVVW